MEHEYEALFRAILELIDKCDTIEELRESVKRIMARVKLRCIFPRLRGGDPNREGMQKSRTDFSPPMRG